MLNLALYDSEIKLAKNLRGSFYPQRTKFLYFRKISDLYQHLNKNILDLIFVSGNKGLKKEIQLAENLKKDPTLALIPLILYHPCPTKKTVIKGLGKGVDEFLFGEWQKDLFSAKLKATIKRSKRDIGVNPSTHLPGTSIIEKEINYLIHEGEEFALCYADLDDFKAYNDYYGYLYGDKLIHLTSQIIKETVYRYCHNGFVGHIGGDDFIFILPAGMVDKVCSEIVRTFDKKVTTRYKARDLKRGYIITHNRKNKLERFPILTLSISVEINRKGMFKHTGEILRMLNDLKKYTKTLPGSKYIIERRKNF